MKRIQLRIYSVVGGEFPEQDKARVIGMHKCLINGTVSLLTIPQLWWNARKKQFFWHVTPKGGVDFWFYESDLVGEQKAAAPSLFDLEESGERGLTENAV